MLKLIFVLVTAAHGLAGDPPVLLWLSSHGDYAYGERAKVHARAAQDGYLVVLHADADGRVHVLFPIDPSGDQQVRGGKKYELKGRGDREAFMVARRSCDTPRGAAPQAGRAATFLGCRETLTWWECGTERRTRSRR